jgi:hypothetical protein
MEHSVHFHVLAFDRHDDERHLSLNDVAYPENLWAADVEASRFW